MWSEVGRRGGCVRGWDGGRVCEGKVECIWSKEGV